MSSLQNDCHHVLLQSQDTEAAGRGPSWIYVQYRVLINLPHKKVHLNSNLPRNSNILYFYTPYALKRPGFELTYCDLGNFQFQFSQWKFSHLVKKSRCQCIIQFLIPKQRNKTYSAVVKINVNIHVLCFYENSFIAAACTLKL